MALPSYNNPNNVGNVPFYLSPPNAGFTGNTNQTPQFSSLFNPNSLQANQFFGNSQFQNALGNYQLPNASYGTGITDPNYNPQQLGGGSGGGGWDWANFLFGDKLHQGALSTGMDLAQTALGGYLGFKNLGLANKQFEFNKAAFMKNLQNQTQLTNQQMIERQQYRHEQDPTHESAVDDAWRKAHLLNPNL